MTGKPIPLIRVVDRTARYEETRHRQPRGQHCRTCGAATRGSPWCGDHLFNSPYVVQVMAGIASQDDPAWTPRVHMMGMRFGRWRVVRQSLSVTGHWHCVCDCGAERVVSGAGLRNGRSQGCRSCAARVRFQASRLRESQENNNTETK